MRQDQQITVRLTEEVLKVLDEIRRKETDIPTRAEMIRRLIERAGKQE